MEPTGPGSNPGAGAQPGALDKPATLLALGPACAEIFEQLRIWFDVPATVTMDLSTIDGPGLHRDLQDPQKVAAFAMRKLQALHLIATPGVPTKPDVAGSLIDSVLRSLVEAPRSQLRRRAGLVDWDQEWEALDAGLLWRRAPDDEAPRFRALVVCLLEARDEVATLMAEGNPTLH